MKRARTIYVSAGILALGCGALCFSPGAAAVTARQKVSFTREIAPILLKRCLGCHGERVNLGGYRAHTFQDLRRAGASKAAPVVPGKPDASRLIQLLTAKSPAVRMPKQDDPLSPGQIALFRQWIAEGAQFDGPDPAAALGSLLGPRRHPAAPAVYRAAVPVLALAFVPGGQELVVGGYHELTVWRSDSGALVRRLPGLPQRIQSLSFSPDGKRLLAAGGTPGEYGEVVLVDPATGDRQVLDTFGDIVLAAAFSRDGKLAAAGGADAGVRVYDVQTGKQLWSSRVHSDWVTGISFSPDGRFLASSSKDMTVKVYEVRNGSLFTTYNGHNRNYGKFTGQYPVYAVQFAPEGPLACSAGGGKVLQLWDPVKASEENGTAADMEERFARESHARYIEHGFQHDVFALVVRDGQVFAGAADGVLKQFDVASLKEVRAYTGHSDWIYALAYDSASRRVATGSYRGEVRVWDTRTGQAVAAFRARPGAAAARQASASPR